MKLLLLPSLCWQALGAAKLATASAWVDGVTVSLDDFHPGGRFACRVAKLPDESLMHEAGEITEDLRP